ncbi:hypothetical protein, partial [Snodgrassella sp. CFCC 13594]|uniref:hypothetical protein n=1 Tax=Snodgrassella sp. CFCC 13594 TaxID=1775559 RepID=UPI000A45DCF6
GRTYVIGNLGGKPINIPYGAINTWVRYEGDPGDFDSGDDAKNYKRPPITYDLPIETFGFQYRIADGAFM